MQKNYKENHLKSYAVKSLNSKGRIYIEAENSIREAFKNIAKEDDNAIIFCTGSLYFASEILNLN